MKVNNIFRSIQGESTYSGQPCIFVRLTGCNLRCSYCDTKYSYNEGKKMSVRKVVKEILKLYKPGDIVEITGGEPLLQKEEVYKLIEKFNSLEFKINNNIKEKVLFLIETNGSILLDNLYNVEYIMDWKLPYSGMNHKMEYANLERLRERDELKFVIGDMNDYEEMKRIIDKYNPKVQIIISTIWENDIREKVVNQMLKDGLDARFQVQLHKIIWDKNRRGV